MAFLGFCWVFVGFLLRHSVSLLNKTMHEAAARGFNEFSGPHFILVRDFDSLIPIQAGSSWYYFELWLLLSGDQCASFSHIPPHPRSGQAKNVIRLVAYLRHISALLRADFGRIAA